jgi:Spy/CpxP family protein refolding chaperone
MRIRKGTPASFASYVSKLCMVSGLIHYEPGYGIKFKTEATKGTMKIKHMVLGLSLLTGMAFAQTGQSTTSTQDSHSQMGEHHRRGDRREDMKEHWDKMATELNLTADQKTQVQGIMKDQMEQARAIKQNSSLSEDQKEAKIKELHESAHSKINAVLTPDQQKKFAEIRKDKREDRKERKHWDKDGKKHHDMDKDDKDKK